MGNVRELDFSDLPNDPSVAQARTKTRSPDYRALDFSDLPSRPMSAIDAGGAVASGVNRGFVSGLFGLPAKTGADVIDLARAAYGYAGSKLGVLKPEDLPEPLDRSKVIGSPEWIAQHIESTPLGRAAISNPRPDVPAARYLNAGGYALSSSMAGRPADMAMQFGSGVIGQGAFEATGDPNWAMLASMGPQVAATGSQAAARGAMRGGEQGRREMEQRIADFKAAGVDPTVGLATGKRLPQAIESTLSRAPGGAGAMAAKAEAIRDQLAGTANTARDQVSNVYGPDIAGNALKRGAESYRTRQQDVYGRMLDEALGKVPDGMTFPASNMLARGEATLADIPGAPNVSGVLNQPRAFTRDVVGALSRDAAPQPARQVPSAILGPNGQPFMSEQPGTPGGLPFEGLRGLRSRVGEMAFQNNPLNADANTGALKQLYGAAKQDIQNAGVMADAQRITQGQQPGVAAGLSRADRFYTQTQKVLDDVLAPIHKAAEAAPERGYSRFESDLRQSGTNVQRTMAALPLDVRRQVAATAIDRLGKATPGQQNAEGNAFSPQTFLTNYAKLPDATKSGLFLGIPNPGSVRDKLDYIAKAVERMNGASKVFANPSGTAGAAASIAQAGGTISGGALMLSGHAGLGLYTLGTVLGSAAAARGGAALMTSPKVVNWLSQTTVLKPEQLPQHLTRLGLMAAQEKDPEARARIEDFAQGLRDELGY